MKSKKNIYILLLVVLSIWGLVIYQFFSFTSPEISQSGNTSVYKSKPIEKIRKDTFNINVNYRDPFLGKMYLKNKNAEKRHVVKAQPAPEINWPNIIYKGIVSDSENTKKVFMLEINGHTYFMSEKQTEKEVTLKNGNRKSILVSYKGSNNEIVLKE